MVKDSTIIIKEPIRSIKSKIVHKMTPEERAVLEAEKADESEYGVHPLFNPKNPRSNVLKYGKSLHLLNLDFDGGVLEDRKERFKGTLDLIYKWLPHEDPKKLGRSYWHRLNPGERIDMHYDNSNGYFRKVNRYHLYLDVPLDFIIVLDGELWNVYPEKDLKNALVAFNLLDWHYFINHTDSPKYMLVFDFYPD